MALEAPLLLEVSAPTFARYRMMRTAIDKPRDERISDDELLAMRRDPTDLELGRRTRRSRPPLRCRQASTITRGTRVARSAIYAQPVPSQLEHRERLRPLPLHTLQLPPLP